MANVIYIPKANPLKFVEKDLTNPSKYATKHLDDFRYADQIQPWETKADYLQKFTTADIIRLQLHANYSPIQVTVFDCDGIAKLSFTASSVLRNKYQTDMFVYDVAINLSTLDAGQYEVQIEAGSPVQKTLISEPIEILESPEGTILIEYSNDTFKDDVIYETGIEFGFRVEASFGKLAPKSKDVLYEDQVMNQVLLSSRPFTQSTFVVGGTFGVPAWVIEKLNFILSCSNTKYDGKYYVKADGANWESKTEENYPMASYSIELRESLHRPSKVFSSTGDSNKKLLLIGNIESKGFGNLAASTGNIIQITDIE